MALLASLATTVAAESSFVTMRNAQLFVGDSTTPFRFISANLPSALLNRDDPFFQDPKVFVLPHLVEQEDWMATIKGLGGQITRTFFFNQPWYNFYNTTVMFNAQKQLITTMLNRVNSVTGIRGATGDQPNASIYRHLVSPDFTETGNELGGRAPQLSPPYNWTLGIAATIKAHAPNTLVMDGTLADVDAAGRWPVQVLKSPLVDIMPNHYAAGSFVNDAKLAAKFGIFNAILENPQVAGGLIWSIRYVSEFGSTMLAPPAVWIDTNHRHLRALHAPGFPTNKSLKCEGFGQEEQTTIPTLRMFAFKIQGLSPSSPHSVPAPPYMLTSSNSMDLRWFGSAWAKSYILSRTVAGTNKWKVLAAGITGQRSAGHALNSDNTAVIGAKYQYAVQAVGVDSPPSAILMTHCGFGDGIRARGNKLIQTRYAPVPDTSRNGGRRSTGPFVEDGPT
ncbi:hypothetical protein BDK51DRAFT_34323 [Blyttiomyces helicus]|uniref:Uncharacterized protein n=1 Tax=Blyttiomyces helicus TaxID=388810 RepID=A0A4P9WPA2_9FUNG|nr:hypothetical protein BDK51DRAFT_34323 [Blyttiomyces helicus]|eukprot:RKO93558.1 hypothetical protein BDK51DRAFT_34323 [Blyttiomyces helicus]